MSEDWEAISKEVSEALASVGYSVYLERAGKKIGPAEDPTFLDGETVPVTVLSSSFSTRDVNGTSIRAGDKLLYLSREGLDTPPQTNDVIIDKGKRYVVIESKPLDPGGVDLMYEVQVRS